MESELSNAIADYIQQRKQVKLEPLQKALDKILTTSDDPIVITEAKINYAQNAAPIEDTYDVVTWLTDAAKRAKQISLATHAAKFTHSDAKSSSILVNDTFNDNSYLVTASLANKAIDAVGNAAALDVARLLKLDVAGESLITQLQQGHVNALTVFTDDAQLLQQWCSGFELALGDSKLASHTLSKQLYFPLFSDDKQSAEYHLLCPLFSSALAHELYYEVRKTRFGDSKEIRDAKKAEKYHAELVQSFPETAIQNFGGSKPQNISQLNNERHGETFLLNVAPPKWKAMSKPPVDIHSIFGRELFFKTNGIIREFCTFLASLRPSERNFHVRNERDNEFLLPIIDALLNHAALIQLMKVNAGWSSEKNCKLKRAHALWLDVYNPDEAFQTEREKADWLVTVAHDFADWLIKQLKSKAGKYVLSDVEHTYFKKLCLHQLKRFERATPKLGEL
jgi:CRISPR-associated protein Csy1